MTENELQNRLMQLTNVIPEATHQVYTAAALSGKREVVMKKKISAVLVFAIILVSITIVACAASIIYNQSWYYNNRGSMIAESKPEVYEAVLKNVVENPEQTQDYQTQVNITIQDVSWLPEVNVLTVSFKASPKDPEHFELHSMSALDQDGAYIGEDGSTTATDDSEDRAMHWLWRNDPEFTIPSRYGPPMDMMDDPGKHLLLIDPGDVFVRDGSLSMIGGVDTFRTADGDVICVAEYDLSWLDEKSDGEIQEWADATGTEYALEMAQATKEARQKAREKVMQDSFVCTQMYTVVEYFEGISDTELYTGGQYGAIDFIIRSAKDN